MTDRAGQKVWNSAADLGMFNGWLEFAGLENEALENDGLENDGPENDGLENDGPENSRKGWAKRLSEFHEFDIGSNIRYTSDAATLSRLID